MKAVRQSDPVVYSVREVSQILHTNVGFVYDLIRAGLLPAIKLKSLRVRKDTLEEFLRNFDGYDLSNLRVIKHLIETI